MYELPVTTELSEKLNTDWYAGYASYKFSYPFYQWLRYYHRARMDRTKKDCLYTLVFENEYDLNYFKQKYNV